MTQLGLVIASSMMAGVIRNGLVKPLRLLRSRFELTGTSTVITSTPKPAFFVR